MDDNINKNDENINKIDNSGQDNDIILENSGLDEESEIKIELEL